MNKPLAQIFFEALIGGWAITRQVSGSENASLEGKAQFDRLSANELSYREDLIVQSGNGQGSAVFQEYLYRLNGDVIEIDFKSNRQGRFVELRLQALTANDFRAENCRHFCAPDNYEMDYALKAPGFLKTTCRVKGPHKAYQIITEYRR